MFFFYMLIFFYFMFLYFLMENDYCSVEGFWVGWVVCVKVIEGGV